MNFDYDGYELKFIQRRVIKDESDHLLSYIYKFRSPITKLDYVLTADYHKYDFFAIKFYPKSLKRSDHKYSIITNRGDIGNIVITCLKSIPLLLKAYPFASFGFAGAPSYDRKSKRLESIINNQRFNIYRYIANRKVGHATFQHYEYEDVSGYMIINRGNNIVPDKMEYLLKTMLSNTYNNLATDYVSSLS